MITRPTLLVLAAGMATRYGSLKQIDSFGPNGETIIDYALYDAIRAGFGKVIFVIRESIEAEFKNTMLNKFDDTIAVEYVCQELDILPEGFSVPPNRVKPWGTGHAVWVAAKQIKEPFAVINADDFYGYSSFKLMADFLKNEANEHLFGLVGYQLKNTLSDHGAVSRGICSINSQAYLEHIAEQTHIVKTSAGVVALNNNKEEIALDKESIVSMNLIGFTPSAFPYFENLFIEFLKKQTPENISQEFYLPDVVNNIIDTGDAHIKVMTSSEKWFGVTFPQDKPLVKERLQALIAAGTYPENLWNKQ